MARRGRGGSVVVPAVGTAVEAAVAGEAAAVTTDVAGRATKRAGRAARKAGAAAERTGEDIRHGRGPLTPARAPRRHPDAAQRLLRPWRGAARPNRPHRRGPRRPRTDCGGRRGPPLRRGG